EASVTPDGKTGYGLAEFRIEQPGRGVARRLAIQSASGEVISAEVDAAGYPDFSTLRLYGWSPVELLAIDLGIRKNIYRELRHLNVPEVRRFVKDGGANLLGHRVLAGLLLSVRAFVGYSALNDGVVSPGGIPGPTPGPEGDPTITPGTSGTDECDSPEEQNGCGRGELADITAPIGKVLDIDGCCNAHDRCYCRQCSSCERNDCDAELHDCILKTTGDEALAAAVYGIVRSIGTVADFDCGSEFGLGAIVAVGAGI